MRKSAAMFISRIPIVLMFPAIALTLFTCNAQSWLYPETIINNTPRVSTAKDSGSAFMRSLEVWGEAGQYVAARDDNHRWNVTLGGAAELYGDGKWSAFFETNMHLVVDPNNNLSFNPRAFIWEEGLFAGYTHDIHRIYIGYSHRCKHDVDNYELLQTTGRVESRSLIYGSGVVRWTRSAYEANSIRIVPLAEAHLYLLLQDQRFPVAARAVSPNVEMLQGAFRCRLEAEYPLQSGVSVSAVGDIRATMLGASSNERFSRIQEIWLEPALELAVSFKGAAGALQVFGRYVYQEDDFIAPQPRPARLFCAGVRLKP